MGGRRGQERREGMGLIGKDGSEKGKEMGGKGREEKTTSSGRTGNVGFPWIKNSYGFTHFAK